MSRVTDRAGQRFMQHKGDINRISHHKMKTTDGMAKFNGKKRTELTNAFLNVKSTKAIAPYCKE